MKNHAITKKRNLFNNIFFFLPMIFIIGFSFKYIQNNCFPKVLGDEFGYWAAAAYFRGWDWSELNSLNAYYGYGYGLILSLILRLPVSQMDCYRIAILLNGVLMCWIYFTAYKIVDVFLLCKNSTEQQKNMILKCSLALLCSISPLMIDYIQFTLSEVFLCFLYWNIIRLDLSLINNYSYRRLIILMLLTAFIIAVHLRAVGVVLPQLLFLICLIRKKENITIKRILYLSFFVTLIISVFLIKKYYQETIQLASYSYAIEADGLNQNSSTMLGQLGKIKLIFSVSGIFSLFKLFVGRLFDSLMSGIFFPGIALLAVIKSLSDIVKRKMYTLEIVNLMTVSSLLFMIAISSVFWIGQENARFDVLTYQRYHGFAIGPVMLTGACSFILTDEKFIKKRCFSVLILGLLSFLLVNRWQDFETTMSNLFSNAPYLFYFHRAGQDVYINVVYCLFPVCVFLLLTYARKTHIMSFILILVAAANFYISGIVYEMGCEEWAIDIFNDLKKIEQHIIDENIYALFYMQDDSTPRWTQSLQFLLGDRTIRVIGEDHILGKGIYIITNTGYKSDDLIFEPRNITYETDTLTLWKIPDG
ncbi:MAG: hypothetical protein J6N21_01020 [Butyrivibrio sp.]|nr:hypothetical protein [Butyrivibrio sp.]